MMDLMELWKSLFDRIYCIHFIEAVDRMPRLTTELNRVGILNSGIFEWKDTYKIPFENEIYKNHKDVFRSVQELSITLSHYYIIKESYLKGYRRILILEDDEVFLISLMRLEAYLRYFPKDINIVRLDYYFGSRPEELLRYKTLNKKKYNDFYTETGRIKRIWSAGNYALDRTGMKHIILNQENKLRSPEYYLYYRRDIVTSQPTRVISNEPLSIQVPFKNSHTNNDSNLGNVQTKRYVTMGINLRNYNEYQVVPRSL